MGTFSVEPSAVVKGNIWVSIKENFFCHVLLKYMVVTRATWLSGDPALSNGMPRTSPSAWKRSRDLHTHTHNPTHPGLKARSVWVNKASCDCSPSLRARGTTHKTLLNPLHPPHHLRLDLIRIACWSMISPEWSSGWSVLRVQIMPGLCYWLNNVGWQQPSVQHRVLALTGFLDQMCSHVSWSGSLLALEIPHEMDSWLLTLLRSN